MYKMIRKKDIRINGKKCDISSRLSSGDVVFVYASERFSVNNTKNEIFDFSNASDELCIVYEDDNILVVDKPCGVTVHCDNEHTEDTLINRIKKYLYNSKAYNPDMENSFAPALCNRLDKNTVGLVVACKNAPSLRILNEAIREGNISKVYHCITVGIPPKDCDILTAFHSKSDKQNMVIVSDEPKENFKPIPIGKIVIVPEWIQYNEKEGEIKVLLDSNMAFGTGEHETTSMCVEFLDKYVRPDDTVIDVGCGSGILGITASKLGAKKVIMTDIDECAVTATTHNMQLTALRTAKLC